MAYIILWSTILQTVSMTIIQCPKFSSETTRFTDGAIWVSTLIILGGISIVLQSLDHGKVLWFVRCMLELKQTNKRGTDLSEAI